VLRGNASNGYMEIAYHGYGIKRSNTLFELFKVGEVRCTQKYFFKPRRLVLNSTASLRQELKKKL